MSTLAAGSRTIEIEGEEITVRRLNVFDMFTVGRMLARVMNEGGRRLTQDFTEEQVVMMLFGGFEYVQEDLTRLCASLLSITPDEFGSMPPETLPALAGVLIESEDLKAFLASCKTVAEKAGKVGQSFKT